MLEIEPLLYLTKGSKMTVGIVSRAKTDGLQVFD
jgi:hypothetical protein